MPSDVRKAFGLPTRSWFEIGLCPIIGAKPQPKKEGPTEAQSASAHSADAAKFLNLVSAALIAMESPTAHTKFQPPETSIPTCTFESLPGRD